MEYLFGITVIGMLLYLMHGMKGLKRKMSQLSDRVATLVTEVQETKVVVDRVLAAIEELRAQNADNPALLAALDQMKADLDGVQAAADAVVPPSTPPVP